MDAGETLKNYRTRARLSQAELANLVGVTDGAVGLWERNRNRPAHGKAEHLDEVLEAKGAVLTAFGYSATTEFATQVELERLREHVDDHEHKIRALTELVDSLDVKLRAMSPGGPSGPSSRRR